jgi:excisionase family DNA binding protein
MQTETQRHTGIELLTVVETAVELRIARPTLYRLIRDRQIFPIKIGSRTFFERVEVERFVASRRARSQPRSGP